MSHTLAIRIPKTLLSRVRHSAKVLKKSRSEVVRKALESYFETQGTATGNDAYSILLSLMPLETGGRPDLASRSEFYLREKFHARARPR